MDNLGDAEFAGEAGKLPKLQDFGTKSCSDMGKNILDVLAGILCPGGELPENGLFLGFVPDAPDGLTALLELPSPAPERYFGGVSYVYRVRVRTRGLTAEDAFARAVAVQKKFAEYEDGNIDIRQAGSVTGTGQDELGRPGYYFELVVRFM